MAPGTDQASLDKILVFVAQDTVQRFKRLFKNLSLPAGYAFSRVPVVAAQNTYGNNTDAILPNESFYPREAHSAFTLADVQAESGYLNLQQWENRGWLIRSGQLNSECSGNLSLALQSLGTLNQVEYQGASGALSILPTAGALLGSPTKELWQVYKLVPIAGVLSMLLSLGGTLMPTQAGDYDQRTPHYSGFISVEKQEEHRLKLEGNMPQGAPSQMSPAERFARLVESRSLDYSGGGRYGRVWGAIIFQACLVAVILIALYYGQVGGVVIWLCTVWAWMYLWYFLVVVTSILENIAGVPFTDSWTMRISRAPSTLTISDEAPEVTGPFDRDLIDTLRAGFNVKSRVSMPKSAFTQQQKCFYAVISKEGISPVHAVLRIIAKWSSVAVFAFGTALFASAQLISISVALLVLALVLGSGSMGRVCTVWIAAQMNRDNVPILYTIVRDRQAAIDHMTKIFQIPDIQIEINGHIIINNRCVWRRSEWLNSARYLGLLASPFDITKIASIYDDGRTYMSPEQVKHYRALLAEGQASSSEV